MGSVFHGGKYLEAAADEGLDIFMLACGHPTPQLMGLQGRKRGEGSLGSQARAGHPSLPPEGRDQLTQTSLSPEL